MWGLRDGVDVDQAEDGEDGGDDADRPPVETHGGHEDRSQGACSDYHPGCTVDCGTDTRRGDLASYSWRSGYCLLC